MTEIAETSREEQDGDTRGRPHDNASARSRVQQGVLLTTAFASGGAVMVVEVLGSRVLGPFFGVGLFVWSALLAVALTALAAGYYAGGVLADRRPGLEQVSKLTIAAGCLVALIPPFAEHVMKAADGLGVRWGALASAAVLLGPSLTAMGMVTTTAVRSALTNSRATGRSVGLLYSVSTLGGLMGTLLAGFVLVPRWAAQNTLAGTAALLVLVGLAGRFVQRRNKALPSVAALVLPVLAFGEPKTTIGENIRVLERSASLLGTLSVVQDDSRSEPLRLLRADHSFIGGLWVNTGEPAFGFVHILEAVRLVRPEGRALLQIGLGIGSLSTAMAKVGIRTDVVEIDPEVIRLARVHFNYVPTGSVHAEDARTLIRRLNARYDFIVHDTFTGGAVPEHLLSVEVLQRLRELLVPGGVLALNFVGADQGPLALGAQAINNTIRAVFPHVRAFRDGPPNGDPSQLANIVFFASSTPIRFLPTTRFESDRCRDILGAFEDWEVLKRIDPAAPVITDANNPLARLTLPVSEAFREAMNDLYPPSFWLR